MLVYGECECFVMQMLYVCVLCASCGSSQFSFPQVIASSEWSRLWHNNWVDSHTDMAVLCAGDWIQNIFLTHIRNV